VHIKHIRILTKQAWSIKKFRYVWGVSELKPNLNENGTRHEKTAHDKIKRKNRYVD
jgi:hypothetical protein